MLNFGDVRKVTICGLNLQFITPTKIEKSMMKVINSYPKK
jgi:hypothetical protein